MPDNTDHETRSFGRSLIRRVQATDFDVVIGFDNENHLLAVGRQVAP